MTAAQMYRSKPVEIEAMLFESADDGSVIAEWCGGTNEVSPEQIQIPTLEGVMTASVGDYIIKGLVGEFYPCKPAVFEQKYEAVEPDYVAPAFGEPGWDRHDYHAPDPDYGQRDA